MTPQKYLIDAHTATVRGFNDLAEDCYKKALEGARALGDASAGGAALKGLAIIYEIKKNYEQMLKSASEAVDANTHFWGSDTLQVAECNELAGRAAIYLRDYQKARSYLKESFRVKFEFIDITGKDILFLVRDLITCDIDTDNFRESVDVHGILLEHYQRRDLGWDQDWPTFIGMHRLVEIYMQEERPQHAERILKGELELLMNHFNHRKTEINCVMKLYQAQMEAASRSLAPGSKTQDGMMIPGGAGFAAQQAGAQGQTQGPPATYQQMIERLKDVPNQADSPAQSVGGLAPPGEKQEADWRNQTSSGKKREVDGDKIRAELPAFLDALMALVQQGIVWQSAMSKLANSNSSTFPTICAELKEAEQELQLFRKELHKSLREIGERGGVEELDALASTLAAPDQTKAGIAKALRSQSESIKESLKSKRKGTKGVLNVFKWK